MTQEQMLRPHTVKTKDVEIPDRGTLRVRELWQRERDEIDHGVVQSELVDGKVRVNRDERGYRARAIACASVNADGSPMFPDPIKGAEQINERWTQRQIAAAFQAVDELSLLTTGAADAVGKDSGKEKTGAAS